MKQTYQGLSTRRIVVESQPLMQFSNQRIKAKTSSSSSNWEERDIAVEEFGMTDITTTDITPAP